MHPDVSALLAVQDDDLAIDGREGELAQLRPRLDALASACARAHRSVEEAQRLLDAEEKRRREVEDRIAHHRQLLERHEGVMNNITNQREAAAATAQLDQTRRFIREEEEAVHGHTTRMAEISALIAERQEAAAEADRARDEAEQSIGVDRDRLVAEIDALRTGRNAKADQLPRRMVGTYDRIRSKRKVAVLHPLRGGSCSHCDTTLPMQRHTQMTATGATEVCEGCGMLLYATE